MRGKFKTILGAAVTAVALAFGAVGARADGTLTVAYDSQPGSLDAQRTTNLLTREVSRTMFETLVTLNGDYQPVPDLAASIETNADRTVFTFPLRRGVMFHNGDEMTAADVVASMHRWLAVNSRAGQFFAGATFEATDDYTVVLTVPEARVDTLYVLASWNSAVIMPQEIAEAAGEDALQDYVGTGPFRFVEWQQDQYIHVASFDGYQPRSEPASGFTGRKEALVDDIYFQFVSDPSTRAAGLQSGQFDIAMRLSTDDFPRFENDPSVGIATSYLGFLQMNYNKREGLMADVTMRQAVNAAINPSEILLGAYSNPAFFALNSSYTLPEQTDWYTEAGSEYYNQNDLDRARELLAEAGYNGETLTILTFRDPAVQNAAIIIKSELERIGMTVEVEAYDFATYAQRRNEPGSWQITIQPFSLNPIPTQYIFFNPGTFGWTDDPQLLDLVGQMQNASVEEARALWPSVQQRSWEYLPISKIGDVYGYSAFNANRVHGFSTFDQGIFWNVSVSD